ncbi:MAG: TatD family hydrolase [Bacteroidia bacterium]|nr:TatD family hydrolase [Bacteroidia bacterium]
MFLNVHSHHRVESEIGILNQEFGQIIDVEGHFSVGIHPYFWKGADFDIDKFESLLIQSTALGESGLDRRGAEPISNQMKLFLQQIELAQYHNKTVIVHCVKAWGELFKILKEYHPKVRFIIHGFNQNEKVLAELLRFSCGISIGFSALNLTSNAAKLWHKIPPEQLFLETDSRQDSIESLYQHFSKLLSISILELIQWQLENWKEFQLFRNSSGKKILK